MEIADVACCPCGEARIGGISEAAHHAAIVLDAASEDFHAAGAIVAHEQRGCSVSAAGAELAREEFSAARRICAQIAVAPAERAIAADRTFGFAGDNKLTIRAERDGHRLIVRSGAASRSPEFFAVAGEHSDERVRSTLGNRARERTFNRTRYGDFAIN